MARVSPALTARSMWFRMVKGPDASSTTLLRPRTTMADLAASANAAAETGAKAVEAADTDSSDDMANRMTEVFNCTRRTALRWALGASVLGWSGAHHAVQAASSRPATLMVLGDSLSAEYGLARGTGWVALLEARLAQQGRKVSVVNASISGETTSGGRSRLPALLQTHRPSLVVIELGANDALRGFPLRSTEDNLRAMVKACRDAGAQVLIVGMRVPPNYGRKYTEDFAQLYVTVARDTRSGLVPFLLKDVADRPDAVDWFQPDRIHPLAKAHPLMLEHVWAGLKPML